MIAMRGERFTAPAAILGLAIALGGTACGGKSTCESNFEASSTLSGKAKPDGVEITTPIPDGATELEIAFTDPGNNWHGEWEPANGAGKLIMHIGDKAVQFGVRIKAANGSEICGASPRSRFVQTPYNKTVREGKAVAPNPSGSQKDKSIHVDEIVPVLSR